MSGRRTETLPERYFAEIYASDPDPWRFTSSAYEAEKYDATLRALPRARYANALEVGCSIGVFTRALAPRCGALTALDIAEAALDAARVRCAKYPHVGFLRGAVPEVWPEGRFDLIVFGEMLYFLSPADLARLVARVEASLEPGGECVLVHWLGETDYPLSGDAAAEGFIAGAARFCRVLPGLRTEAYRLDVLRRADRP
ncbi:MAG TPA: SAM-dependent methyltransferase [Methylobacterium sp.]|jgi:cyclopropane fatty-acyl-phospholipid synthase-like methyltransferase|uniref:SAM-dependent methyltransferase n=1 Tax=Methylorubrum sp. B1-46 TaxID=2897334 RepID=UPI001E3F3ED8|nr:SAM-dependent methyltransferase [Methylorubrum sp. B1-46]UGB25097.1 nodulation S family protein [Methylorubrum sp. B1-46]HEV2541247.1 SAM-dependent methyltransferase [Methylobacterium sp.]